MTEQRLPSGSGILGVVPVLVLAAQPAYTQGVQTTAVWLNPTLSSLEVLLETISNASILVQSSSTGKSFSAEISNAKHSQLSAG